MHDNGQGDISHKKKGLRIVPLVEGDPILLNLIAAIEVSPKRFPNVNNADVVKFVNWLCEDEAQMIIKDFKVKQYGEPLFFPNSDQWNKSIPSNIIRSSAGPAALYNIYGRTFCPVQTVRPEDKQWIQGSFMKSKT